MHYLVYLSASAPLFEEKDLKDILRRSRDNNLKAGITGLLLFHEGSFIQVLEGEKEKLDALYEKISIDPRHKRLIKLLDEPLEQRNFGEWTMGYKTLTTDEVQQVTGFRSLTKENLLQLLEPANHKEKKIVALLRSFVKGNF